MAFSWKRKLKLAYRDIKASLKSPNCSDWIVDNFYIIDRHYRAMLKNRRALKYPSLFELLTRYCELHDYKPSPSGLVNYLKSTKREYEYNSLCSVVPLLSACAIIKIAELQNAGKDKQISSAVKMMISVSDPRFCDIIPELWQTEKLLIENEEQYRDFDSATKSQYRKAISAFARESSLNERDAAAELLREAKANGTPLGTILFAPKPRYKMIWILLILAVFAAIFAVALMTIGLLSLLLIVPFFVAACSVADMLASVFVPAYKAPRLELTQLPDDAKTLVTVAALMNGGRGDDEVFESLLKFRYMNPDKNIYFCLLADLPDSESRFQKNDAEIIANAKKKIDELNQLHGDSFCMFFRQRVLNKSENRFGGWERKRGAVCELVSHIVNGDKNEYYGGSFINEIKYILTLDSDTNLSVGSVLEMLSVALHPVNRPRVKEGRVVSGYGIIQPSVRTELTSAYRTFFSRLISGSGGADGYATATFHRSQTLFGSGNFCGKGLIDVLLFHDLVSGKIPDGIVLSHDVIEGSILHTLCASDIVLTDSTPANTVSFFRRLHRWIRGDFQNLFFLRGALLNSFSKWRMLLTLLRHSSCVFSLIAIVVGAFTVEGNGLALLLLAYIELFLPCVLSLLRFLFSGSPFGCLRFFSKASSLIAQTVARLFFEISSACRRAVLTLNAFFLAATRMVTKRKTLEWTTAAQTEMLSSTLGKYVLDSISSVMLGLFLLVFAKAEFLRLSGLLFFVYPLVSTLLSRTLDGGAEVCCELTEKQKKKLTCHAIDMLGFYNDNVGEDTNYLPPDNIQLSPVSSKAMRTSPTNIGFYFVSMLASRDLKLLSSRELYERLDLTLSTVERLPKYKGNLFNWYDISSLSALGEKYVSTVDCGNFMVMLVVLKEGLREYEHEEPRLSILISRCERLLADAELLPFYDKRRELFRIGLKADNEKADEGCYDLLMSEMRMTAYYSVAKSIVPKRAWQALGRTLTHKNGYIGMKSWSGTSFEYLMPQLFLPLYRDSFLYESIAFSVMVQRNENPIWGVSESGFYSFDSEMNYQYKANGIQTLALRRIARDEKVISPYSTYLSLCICQNAALRNLSTLENQGMYGKYGLYEALDFNNGSGGLCVKSYMAHHVGMSIIAVMNAIDGNRFIKRFMSDKSMGAAKELLQEKIPIDAHVFEDNIENDIGIKRPLNLRNENTEKTNLQSPSVKLLNRGDLTALISGNGHIGLQCGQRLVANTQFDKFSMRFTPAVMFSRGSESFGCCELLGVGSFAFERGNDFCSHIVSGRVFSGRVRYSMAKDCNCFVVSTKAESLKKYDITLAFEPVLESKKKFLSHISFSRLFVESEYDKSKRILYFHRRSGQDGSHVFTVAVAPKDKAMAFDFLTNREQFKASSVSSPLDYSNAIPDNKTGACIDPICIVKSSGAEGGRATFLISCGETKSECERNIRLARASKGDYRQRTDNSALDRILPSLLYEHSTTRVSRFSNCRIGDLWQRRISGDYPIVTVFASETAIMRTESVIKAFLTLAKSHIRFELLFVISDSDSYYRPIEASVRECIANQKATQFIDKNGGIFLLRAHELGDELMNALKNISCCVLDFSKDFIPHEQTVAAPKEIVTSVQSNVALPIADGKEKIGNGFFVDDGYVSDKSSLPDSPYSFILTGYRFSSVLTQSSLGYTFFDNARERRLCSFFGDAKSLDNGERIFAEDEGKRYDLCAIASKVLYQKGSVEYHGMFNKKSYTVSVTIPPKLPIKLIRVRFEKGVSVKTIFAIEPIMGDSVAPINGVEAKPFSVSGNNGLMFKNIFGMTFPEGFGFAGGVGCVVDGFENSFFCESNEALFFLGAAMTERGAVETVACVDKHFFDASGKASRELAESFVPKISVSTEDKATDLMLNFFAPYQVAASRFFARGSFWQSGGAYGFRDQLQDCLTLVYSMPQAVRTHIIRCCAHQYLEGCVMHWWHTRRFGRVNRGIKSKCSDDMLYLPIVAADYYEKTDDESLFDVEIHYLVSKPLGVDNERYEQPELSDIKESVYHHCLRALSYAEQRGKNGLILMGSCDWNDAFSLVGEKGIGESVFTTLLFIIAAEKFIPIMELREDFESANRYRNLIDEFKATVENVAFHNDRYARAICDDGTVLGVEGSEECEIDILSQAFASIAGLNKTRTEHALKLAFSKLYDDENMLFKLFSPPFANGRAEVGYIRGYVAGIRENGGQYTHGALWGALGFIKAKMYREALAVLACANPVTRYMDKELAKKYKNEPYAISADVYSGAFGGRGGWSHYTGAASWYYRIMLEYVLGLKLGADSVILSANPIIPFEANLTLSDSHLTVIASRDIKTPTLNGNPISFPLKLSQPENTLELPIYQ